MDLNVFGKLVLINFLFHDRSYIDSLSVMMNEDVQVLCVFIIYVSVIFYTVEIFLPLKKEKSRESPCTCVHVCTHVYVCVTFRL